MLTGSSAGGATKIDCSAGAGGANGEAGAGGGVNAGAGEGAGAGACEGAGAGGGANAGADAGAGMGSEGNLPPFWYSLIHSFTISAVFPPALLWMYFFAS